MKLIKTLIYIRRYFESKRIFNGLINGNLTVKILSQKKFHIKVYDNDGDFVIEMMNKHLSFIPKTTEDVISIMSQLNEYDKEKALAMSKSLSNIQEKLMKFNRKYNKFIVEAPTTIV